MYGLFEVDPKIYNSIKRCFVVSFLATAVREILALGKAEKGYRCPNDQWTLENPTCKALKTSQSQANTSLKDANED